MERKGKDRQGGRAGRLILLGRANKRNQSVRDKLFENDFIGTGNCTNHPLE